MLRSLLADLLNPLVWNLSDNAARKFYHFSCMKYSGVQDLLLAARKTDSDHRAAKYVKHLEDEYKHSSIFLNHANIIRQQKSLPALPHPGSQYEQLFELLGEKRFLALVHLGKKRGTVQCNSYARYFDKKGDAYTASIFKTVLEDDIQHMNYTYELLEALCGSRKTAQKELKLASRWEMRRQWMRSGRALTSKIFFFITISIYPLFLPYKLIYLAIPAPSKKSGWNI